MKATVLSFSILAFTSAIANAEVLPVSSAIRLIPYAAFDGDTERGNKFVSQGTTLDPLQESSSVTALTENGSLTVFTSISAAWAGPDAGTVAFGPTGMSSMGNGPGGYRFSFSFPPPSTTYTSWSYEFTPTTNGTFDFDWDVGLISSINPAFLSSHGIRLIINGDGPTYWDLLMEPDSTGSHSVPLTANQTTKIELVPSGAVVSTNFGSREIMLQANINWSIVPSTVPEPSTLLTAGLFGLGWFIRGRKKGWRVVDTPEVAVFFNK